MGLRGEIARFPKSAKGQPFLGRGGDHASFSILIAAAPAVAR